MDGLVEVIDFYPRNKAGKRNVYLPTFLYPASLLQFSNQ